MMPFTRYCVRCAEANHSTPEANLNTGRPRGPRTRSRPKAKWKKTGVRGGGRRWTREIGRSLIPTSMRQALRAAARRVGGLAGSNEGHGDPRMSELQDASGSSNFDVDDDRADEDAPTSGPSGGAVGGTPRGSMRRGGRRTASRMQMAVATRIKG